MKLLFIVNAPEFFLSHRLPIAEAARKAGFDVHVATGPGSSCARIAEMGFTHYELQMSRSGRNLVTELRCIYDLFRLMRQVRPGLIHLVTIKPVLYGGIVARLVGVPAVVAAISGLGTVFVSKGWGNACLRFAVKVLYRLALGHHNLKVIFQNSDDRSIVMNMGAVSHKKTILIRGSGISLNSYSFSPELGGVPVVTFASRFLKDKGVLEFIEASRLLKERGVECKFWLVGSVDPENPSSITEDEVTHWSKTGLIEILGYRNDIAHVFSLSNIVVLPSYREGLPKVLMEAAACGRCVVTTNVPGCRDAIEVGKTGLLVPVRDAKALADAIQSLIENPKQRWCMGKEGRTLAEREFAIEKVVSTHMRIYQNLLSMKGSR